MPLVIHIFEPLIEKRDPSLFFTAVVAIPKTSVPAPGSDIPIPPIVRPEQASGRYFNFCSWLPFCDRLLTKSIEWARYDKQNAGSDAESSSAKFKIL